MENKELYSNLLAWLNEQFNKAHKEFDRLFTQSKELLSKLANTEHNSIEYHKLKREYDEVYANMNYQLAIMNTINATTNQINSLILM